MTINRRLASLRVVFAFHNGPLPVPSPEERAIRLLIQAADTPVLREALVFTKRAAMWLRVAGHRTRTRIVWACVTVLIYAKRARGGGGTVIRAASSWQENETVTRSRT